MEFIILAVSGTIVILFSISILVRALATKSCPKCGSVMKRKLDIGDGDGPAPEHSIWECTGCLYNEEELL